jgi:hypothetical protein
MVDVVTDEPSAAACPSCGVVSMSVKDHVVTSPKDIPYGEGQIIVRWNKVRWRCREDYCKQGIVHRGHRRGSRSRSQHASAA